MFEKLQQVDEVGRGAEHRAAFAAFTVVERTKQGLQVRQVGQRVRSRHGGGHQRHRGAIEREVVAAESGQRAGVARLRTQPGRLGSRLTAEQRRHLRDEGRAPAEIDGLRRVVTRACKGFYRRVARRQKGQPLQGLQ
ncbi:hypothetical protein D3C87_1308390 [compost metagenome]